MRQLIGAVIRLLILAIAVIGCIAIWCAFEPESMVCDPFHCFLEWLRS